MKMMFIEPHNVYFQKNWVRCRVQDEVTTGRGASLFVTGLFWHVWYLWAPVAKWNEVYVFLCLHGGYLWMNSNLFSVCCVCSFKFGLKCAISRHFIEADYFGESSVTVSWEVCSFPSLFFPPCNALQILSSVLCFWFYFSLIFVNGIKKRE